MEWWASASTQEILNSGTNVRSRLNASIAQELQIHIKPDLNEEPKVFQACMELYLSVRFIRVHPSDLIFTVL